MRASLVDLGSYPGLRPGPREVEGELYTYEDIREVLDRLDRIEGYQSGSDNLFESVVLPVHTDHVLEYAWCYSYPHEGGEELRSGSWTRRHDA